MAEAELLPTDIAPSIGGPTDPLPPLLPKKPSPLFVIAKIAGTVVVVTLIWGIVFGRERQRNDVTAPPPTPTVDLSRYDEDPDNDKIPSFVEAKAGLDPTNSEIEACFANRCNVPSIQEVNRKPRNVMIVVDSSGSMAEPAGAAAKMDSAKLAITEYLKKSDTLPFTNVGLAVYGHKGSNREVDKHVSCASGEVLAPLGQLTGASVSSVLAGIQPVGWTPIGLGLSRAKDEIVAAVKANAESKTPKEEAINEVVVISDGVETCDTNPIEVARQLTQSPEKITVHVIGFAVDSGESGELKKIAEAGGGTYATAPTIEELKVAMDLQWENYVRKTREAACDREGAKLYYACIDRAIQLVRSWVSAELSRDPRVLPYAEKLRIDRLRWVVPAYMRGRLDDPDYLPPSEQ